jgi:hypothetical protein
MYLKTRVLGQNYDDQFDDLNAQISALKSQVDGLSSLSGQVSSLSGTISGLQSGIAAATAAVNAIPGVDLSGLTASLATLQAEVDAIEAAIATTATATEVAALQTSLTAVETDLADLLTSNNVYASTVTITDASTMAAALALGNRVALMNAAVSITDSATISDTDVQTFIDRIKTTTAGFRYDSGSTTGYAPTFDEMVSASTFDIESAGPVSAKKLAAATVVTIVNTYTTKVTSLDLGAMASVTTIKSGADGSEVSDNLTLSSATNIDLGALTAYNVSGTDAITIAMKKGGTLDIASLTGTEKSTGLEEPLSLTVSGPASLSVSKIADGTMTVSDVASLTVSGFYGSLDVNSGVETLTTTDTVKIDLVGAVDVITATLDFKYDWDPSLTTAQAAVADDLRNTGYLTDLDATGDWVATDLKTLTVTGELLDLYLDEANLETLSIDATMHDLTISSATDLSSLTVATGSKIGNISVTASNNLTVADFNHTTNLNNKLSSSTAGTSTNSANLSATFSVTNNTSLTKLHSTGDDVGTLTVTGNSALVELDFTGLADDGGDLTPAANVYNNDLTATSASNTSDGDTDRADGLTTDLGSFDDGTSGMDSLKTYLTHVVADSDFAGYVSFDTLSTETDTETAGSSTVTLNTTYTNATTFNEATVLYEVAAGASTSTGGSATKGKRSYLLDISGITQAQFTANGQDLIDINGDGVPAFYIFTGQTASTVIAALNDSDNKAVATANGVTMNAAAGGNSTLAVHVGSQLNSAKWETTAAAITNLHLTASDVITLTVGNQSVTTTAATSNASYEIYSVAKSVGAAIATRWAAVNTGASAIIFEVGTAVQASSSIYNTGGHMLTFTSKDKGTDGAGLSASLSISALDATGNNGTLPVAYGATNLTSDNTSTGPDVILTFESNVAGLQQNVIGLPATSAASGTFGAATLSHAATGIGGISELHTNYKPRAGTGTPTYLDVHPDESWSDVRYPEDDNTVTTAGSAAVAKNRIAWLG